MMALRSEYLETFEQALAPVGLLDRFKVAGVIATWWTQAYDELKTIVAQGFTGLIDGWINTIRDFVEGEDDQKDNDFKPFEHKIVPRLVPEYLQELADAEAEVERLKGEKEAFERGEHLEDSDEEYDGKENNYAKDLEEQRKRLKEEISASLNRIKFLSRGPNVKDRGSIAAQKKLGQDTVALEAELARLHAEVAPVLADIEVLDGLLEPYDYIKKALTEARSTLKSLKTRLVQRLEEAHSQLSPEEDQDLVLGLIRDDIETQLNRYVTEHKQLVIEFTENLWDKYKIDLHVIEDERNQATEQLTISLGKLGYE